MHICKRFYVFEKIEVRMRRTLFFALMLGIVLIFSVSVHAESKPFVTPWKGEAGKELKIPIFGTNYKLVIKKAEDQSILRTEPSITVNETNLYYKYTPPESIDLLMEEGPEGVEFICFFSDDAKCGSSEALLSVEKFDTVAWKSYEGSF